jgi:hypothetical protein
VWLIILQGVVEELVHLGDLGGHGQVDGAVANLDDETAEDVWVDLVCNLQLLALTNVLRLLDGGLEAGKSLVVELLHHLISSYPYRSRYVGRKGCVM